MAVHIISIPQALEDRLGYETSRLLVEWIGKVMEQNREEILAEIRKQQAANTV